MYQALIRQFSASSVLLLLFALSGCATVQYHDWHEGEASTGAVLVSSETILIESINGQQTDSAFIGQTHRYELTPGEYAVVVTYADIYEKTADDFEKVKSNPVKLEFAVEAGVSYQFEHREIAGLDDAETFAVKPAIKLINVKTGQELATDIEYTTPKSILSRLKFETEQDQVFASEYLKDSASKESGASSSGSDSATLKMLKFSWKEASPADRAAFIQWMQAK